MTTAFGCSKPTRWYSLVYLLTYHRPQEQQHTGEHLPIILSCTRYSNADTYSYPVTTWEAMSALKTYKVNLIVSAVFTNVSQPTTVIRQYIARLKCAGGLFDHIRAFILPSSQPYVGSSKVRLHVPSQHKAGHETPNLPS